MLQVSIDLFILAQHYVDVATLGQLTQTTSGQLYLYQPFNQAAHSDTLFNDLRWNIVRPQVRDSAFWVDLSPSIATQIVEQSKRLLAMCMDSDSGCSPGLDICMSGTVLC